MYIPFGECCNNCIYFDKGQNRHKNQVRCVFCCDQPEIKKAYADMIIRVNGYPPFPEEVDDYFKEEIE